MKSVILTIALLSFVGAATVPAAWALTPAKNKAAATAKANAAKPATTLPKRNNKRGTTGIGPGSTPR